MQPAAQPEGGAGEAVSAEEAGVETQYKLSTLSSQYMHRIIPAPLLSVCAEIAARRETHATLDSLFTYAGALGNPPEGSKPAKALAWLRNTNKDKNSQPMDVLGRLIENYMEEIFDPDDYFYKDKIKDREKITNARRNADFSTLKAEKLLAHLAPLQER